MPRLNDESIRRQKATHFQAAPRPCTCLKIKVLRANNVTLGWLHDKIDTPDPYVTLRIPHSAEVFAKTTPIRDNKNPVWNETFIFHIDKQAVDRQNILEIALWDFDTFNPDDKVGDSVLFELNELPDNDTVLKTFTFGKAKVFVQFEALYEKETYHLRYGEDLCDEEKAFLGKRRPFVLEAMKELLGERGPQNLDEVPNIAVLGSGGGYRAATGFTAVCRALEEMQLIDCVTYMAGLSGSAWSLSLLYVHSKGGRLNPTTTQESMREHLKARIMGLFLPHKIKQYVEVVKAKLRAGLPVSFTDIYGQIVGTHLLGDEKDKHTLSEQQENVKEGQNPLPIYTALNSKKDLSAEMVSEWVEFTPYEIGMEKYGTFMKTELFGSKFFCGKLVKQHKEPPICYYQGIWGSFFAILIQRVLEEKQEFTDDVMNRLARFSDSVNDDVRSFLRHNRASLSSGDVDEDPVAANGDTLESADLDLQEDVFESDDVSNQTKNGDTDEGEKSGTKRRPKAVEKITSGIKALTGKGTKASDPQGNGDSPSGSLERPKTADQKASGLKAPKIGRGKDAPGDQSSDQQKNGDGQVDKATRSLDRPQAVDPQKNGDSQVHMATRSLDRPQAVDPQKNGDSQVHMATRSLDRPNTANKARGIKALTFGRGKNASSNQLIDPQNKAGSLDRPKTADQKARGIKALEYVMEKIPSLRTRRGRAGLVHNFLRGVDLRPAQQAPPGKDAVDSGDDVVNHFHRENARKKKIELIDAGLQFNSPYPPVLRPERDVDLILSFDFSARDKDSVPPFKNLKLAEKWAKNNSVPFPPINDEEQFEKEGWKECYVFKDLEDDTCPIVMHFVLINNLFQKFKKPSVPRTTLPEVTEGSFKVFDDPTKCYSTFNLNYTNSVFDNLSRLVEFNTEVNKPIIEDAIAECVQRRRRDAQA